MSPPPVFLIIAAVMIVLACASLVVPLMRARERPAPLAAGAVIAGLPLATLGLYLAFSNWSWNEPPPPPPAHTQQQAAEIEEMVVRLEQRLRDQPEDLEGWIMLGRTYVVMGRYEDALEAYRQARSVSDDASIEAITGYAEVLAVSQGSTIGDEAMALFERALQVSPDDRKALWYGGLGAMERGQPAVARQRWQRLLAFNPPEQMAQLLREQIALTEAIAAETAEPVADNNGATLTVAVVLGDALRAQVPAAAPLFVLARPANGGGPPLAVVRRSVADLPLTLELSDADSMMAGRALSGFDEVEVVARIALGGTPVAQPGDLYGSLVTANDSTVSIVIDKVH